MGAKKRVISVPGLHKKLQVLTLQVQRYAKAHF